MRILILRHGEPDYARDCLTEKGIEQAKRLDYRLAHETIREFFTSPMGRAQETCAETLRLFPGQEAIVCDWLHEFDLMWTNPNTGKQEAVWDVPPDQWTEIPSLSEKDGWYRHPAMQAAGMEDRILAVNVGIDAILARYGLIREGGHYRVQKKCSDTIALFCHYGAMCAVTAHLLHISPMILWQGTNADHTAVTELCTDDRFGSVANWRINTWNDTHHLTEQTSGLHLQSSF
ncbi:MAG: histidine phosphatase family protein [Oscillospiraceae bacterium]|nr:histidine phosphatase family protein [Oscillospiraceae bacterium]